MGSTGATLTLGNGRRIGIFGIGNLGSSLIEGLGAAGFPRENLFAYDKNPSTVAKFQDKCRPCGIAETASAEVLILAVKPFQMSELCQELSAHLRNREVLAISCAAAYSLQALQTHLGLGPSQLVRAMPNLAVAQGLGVSGVYGNSSLAPQNRMTVEQIFSGLGKMVWLQKEQELDFFTAAFGSGPGSFCRLLESFETAILRVARDEDCSLTEKEIRDLLVQNINGTLLRVKENGNNAGLLRQQVTTPNGTTAALVSVLDHADIDGILSRAIAAAAQRSREISGEVC